MFSYDTPLSPGGLYVNLNSWQAFGEEFVQLDAQRSGQALYLLQQFQKVLGGSMHPAVEGQLQHHQGATPAAWHALCTGCTFPSHVPCPIC